jgi:arginase
MNVNLIQIPYDSGQFMVRTGRGSEYFIRNGLPERLQQLGHRVTIQRIRSGQAVDTEIGTFFEINRKLSKHLRASPTLGFPVVLAGNCNSCIGTLAGIGPQHTGIIWFDSHGDFNTPETTVSGFLDGMGLAMATGRCWRSLLPKIPGYQAVPDSRVVHVGALDLDDAERVMLQEAGIPLVSPRFPAQGDFQATFARALTGLKQQINRVYLHVDLDVLAAGRAKANQFGPGCLSLETVLDCLQLIANQFEIAACTVASVDPACDIDRAILDAGIRIVETILEKGGGRG